jgi:hypothetical protein
MVSNIVRYELLEGGKSIRAIEDVGGAAPTASQHLDLRRR